jgi:putative toxin-antitoxin system antitoxin component (TIGR02293 family)
MRYISARRSIELANVVVQGPKKARTTGGKTAHPHIAGGRVAPGPKIWPFSTSVPTGANFTRSVKEFYVNMYRASPIDRIEVIKAGVPARDAKLLMRKFDFDQHVLFGALSLKTATVNKKAAANQSLSTEDGERVLGLAKLVGQVAAMLDESGEPENFDVPAWLSQWLREPLPALGGTMPLKMLDTMEGQALVSQTLAQIQSGAYA